MVASSSDNTLYGTCEDAAQHANSLVPSHVEKSPLLVSDHVEKGGKVFVPKTIGNERSRYIPPGPLA